MLPLALEKVIGSKIAAASFFVTGKIA